MPEPIVTVLAQGGATALLLGIVLMVLMPRQFKLLEEHVKTFAEQLSSERDAHREESRAFAAAITKLAEEVADLTREVHAQGQAIRGNARWLEEQTNTLKELTRDLADIVGSRRGFGALRPRHLAAAGGDDDVGEGRGGEGR